MNIRRVFSMETNLRLKNLKDFSFQKEYIIDRVDEQPVCFYMDAATYNNLGDQAIALATEWLLNDVFGKEHVRVINESELIGYIKSLKRQIKSGDVIVLGGGGNMGDLYPRYESLRRLVIKSFPNNKIVIFPQTIDYSEDKYGQQEFERAKKIYGSHKKLVLCAREEKTYKIFRNCCDNVLLVPDIVLYLTDKVTTAEKKMNMYGICLREDRESLISEDERHKLFESLKNKDIQFEKVTTMSALKNSYSCFEDRRRAVQLKIDEFASYKLIITDRLHGMIFSILASTPCVALDNRNHKVSGVYEIIKDKKNNNVVITQYGNMLDVVEELGQRNDISGNEGNINDIYFELVNCLNNN